MSNEHSSVTMTPKLSFTLGLIGGILVICTIGFFIMLSVVLSGKSLGSKTSAPTTIGVVPSAPAPAAAGAPQAGPVAPVTTDDHIRGNANAPVTIIEYSDFECPFCARFHPSMAQLMNEFDGRVRWVYRHFPLSFHPQAAPAANAAECAGEQGKFWEFADALFENQSVLGGATYTRIATSLNLNMNSFESCVSSNKYGAKVSADQGTGVTAGVTGTPGSIIVAADGSTQLVPGAVPYEQLRMMVEAAF